MEVWRVKEKEIGRVQTARRPDLRLRRLRVLFGSTVGSTFPGVCRHLRFPPGQLFPTTASMLATGASLVLASDVLLTLGDARLYSCYSLRS